MALIGGWTVAAALQRGGFDQVTGTISALAARDADHREVMTAALAALGICHLATAAALRSAGRPARVLYGVGGAATVLVAAFPLPAGGGSSVAHTTAAAVAFGSLAAWPALVRRPATGLAVPAVPAGSGGSGGSAVPAGSGGRLGSRGGRSVDRVAAGVLLGLVGWFAVELITDGAHVGLSERVTAGAQATWPLLAVLRSRVP